VWQSICAHCVIASKAVSLTVVISTGVPSASLAISRTNQARDAKSVLSSCLPVPSAAMPKRAPSARVTF